MGIADIGYIDSYPIANAFDVKKVSAKILVQAVYEKHVGSQINQPSGNRCTDESEPTGYQDLRVS